MRNRSVPVDTVLPHVVYEDVAAALAWLCSVFSFTEYYRYTGPDGSVQGAQIQLGDAWIMLASAREYRASPAQLGGRPQYLTVFVGDVDAHFHKARTLKATTGYSHSTPVTSVQPSGERRSPTAEHASRAIPSGTAEMLFRSIPESTTPSRVS